MPGGMDGLCSSRELTAWSNPWPSGSTAIITALCLLCQGLAGISLLLTPSAVSSGQAEVVHTAGAAP